MIDSLFSPVLAMVFDDKRARLGTDGALILTVQMAVPKVYRIEPWDRHLSCSVLIGDKWKPAREETLIPIINLGLSPDSNHGRFIASIPQDIVEAIGPIQYWQFALLQWVSMDQRAADLVKSAPLLLWLLYHNRKKFPEKWDDERWFNVLDLKRHEIFQEMFGWSSKSAVRALGKIKLSNGGIRDLHAIHYFCMDEENIKDTAHMKVIPVHLLMVMRKYLNWGKFFERFKQEDYPGGVEKALADAKEFSALVKETCLVIAALYGRNREKQMRKPYTCSSLEQLQKMHDQLTYRLNMQRDHKRLKQMRHQYRNFPSPPLPGTNIVQAVSNIELLLDEGKEMNHCVTSYADKIMRRECYIYRVYRPERATLEVEIVRGKPKIVQFKLKNNHNPSEKSWNMARLWLKTARIKLEHKKLLAGGEPVARNNYKLPIYGAEMVAEGR